MKFGNTLTELARIDSKYGYEYFQYNLLKKHIKQMKEEKQPKKEVEFVQMMDIELQRIKKLISTKIEELRNKFRTIEKNIEIKGRNNCDDSDEIHRLKQFADDLADELSYINTFAHYNNEGFRKIVKKHDKAVGIRSYWFEAQKQGQFFDEVSNEVEGMLVQLSDLYEHIRNEDKLSCTETDADAQQPSKENKSSQESFERKSSKYWVNREDVFKLKTMLVKHLPIFIFHRGKDDVDQRHLNRRKISIMLDQHQAEFEKLKSLQKTGWISSVYFDSSDLHSYHKRLDMKEGSTLIRLRWYADPNELSGSKDENCFIPNPPATGSTGLYFERKTHHESWVLDRSLKERFPIDSSSIMDYVTGRKSAADCCLSKSGNALAEDIQREIVKKRLVPIVRTVYKRSAFQLVSSDDVRITLDQSLSFVNEHPDVRDQSLWYRPTQTIECKEEDCLSFKAAVLEVKLKTDSPPWLEEILSSPIIRMVSKFSKFQQGAASFNADRVKIFPYWFEEEEMDQAKLRTERIREGCDKVDTISEDLNRKVSFPRMSLTCKSNMKAYVNGGFTDAVVTNQQTRTHNKPSASKSENSRIVEVSPTTTEDRDVNIESGCCFGRNKSYKKATKRLKIEPKTYFANERTFMQWGQAGMFLLGVGGALVGIHDQATRNISIMFFALSLFMFIYACTVFYVRLHLIKKGNASRFDDWFGPGILTVFLIGGICATFYMSPPGQIKVLETVFPQFESPSCHRLPLQNTPLFFTPSDLASIDPDRRIAWTCSDNRIAMVDLDTGVFKEEITVGGNIAGSGSALLDFESLTFANDPNIIYIGSEGELNGILEYDISKGAILRTMSFGTKWGNSNSLESLAYMDTYMARALLPNASVSIVGNGTFIVRPTRNLMMFYVPVDHDRQTIDAKKIKVPRELEDEKVGAMTVHENILYLLFDNVLSLVGLDLITGAVTIHRIPGTIKNWEGLLFRKHDAGLWVYLSKDNPAEIWRFEFNQSKGFSGC
ncbi:unnamed protein product [Owenia fusiformis]|uniref:SPX domain-containing protein n=1 Tax=Owenia fusiformis TaxID=6347 RepID=A0A8S4P1C0_OWEFU|nr:unnamed protein product [Owenia fusiformis]